MGNRAHLSFNEAYAIGEINSVMRIQKMKWENTLSGNSNNPYLMFSTNSVGARLLQGNRTYDTGFFGNVYMLPHEKAIKIFEFIDDLDVAG